MHIKFRIEKIPVRQVKEIDWGGILTVFEMLFKLGDGNAGLYCFILYAFFMCLMFYSTAF